MKWNRIRAIAKIERILAPPLGGSWPSEARSERTLSVSFADSSPRGRAKGALTVEWCRGGASPSPTAYKPNFFVIINRRKLFKILNFFLYTGEKL